MHIFSWGTAVPCWCQTLELSDLGAEGKVEGGVKHNHSLSNTRAHTQPQRLGSDWHEFLSSFMKVYGGLVADKHHRAELQYHKAPQKNVFGGRQTRPGSSRYICCP